MARTTVDMRKRRHPALRRLPRDWRYRLSVNAKLRVESIKGFKRRWFVRLNDPRAHLNADHVRVLNRQLMSLRQDLIREVRRLPKLSSERFKTARHQLDRRIVPTQKLWDFFFDMFSQRKSIYTSFLRRCDCVVSECYKTAFQQLGRPDPWTRTPPLCYVEMSFSFATIRRGVRLSGVLSPPIRTPFPVVKIPYDRVANPWTLTSLVHEAAHDIHGDVPGFWKATQRRIYRAVRRAKLSKEVARTWSFWHKETLADLLAILFGGPAVVHSLSDLMSRPRGIALRFRPHDSHPTPYLRVLISTYALRQLGFAREATDIERRWKKRYPLAKGHKIPKPLLESADRAIPLVAKTLLWTPYPQLGGKRLVDLVSYPKAMHRRVLAGSVALADKRQPRGLPARLIISAGVYAFERKPEAAKAIRGILYKALDTFRTSTAAMPTATRRVRPWTRAAKSGVGYAAREAKETRLLPLLEAV